MTTQTPRRVNAEETRTKVGFSRSQWIRFLECGYPLQDLSNQYDAFVAYLLANIEREFLRPSFVHDGVPYLSATGVANALGIGEFLIANLRARGKLSSGLKLGRRNLFAKGDLIEFVKSQSSEDRRSAMASAFVRWLRIRDPEFTMVDD